MLAHIFSNSVLGWVVFNAFVIVMLVLDLAVFHRGSRVVSVKESLWWVAFWTALALVFNAIVWHVHGPDRAMEFLAGYTLELSLSVDNLFIFILIFAYFKVPQAYQHKVLFWGIIGAIAMRALFIVAGVALISRFGWIIYLFGAFLIFTGIKMALKKDEDQDLEKNWVIRMLVNQLPFTRSYDGGSFFTKVQGKRTATPLLLVLLCVETTDVLFATDSIPLIFGITANPYIIYTSNIFAVLGLRSIFFALAGMMDLFHFLHYGLASILVFVGCKMLASFFEWHVPVGIALGVVALLLGGSIVASLIWPQPKGHAH